MANADIVLIANLTEIRFDPPLTVSYSENRQTLVDIRVESYLKGSGPPFLTIADPAYTVIEAENGQPKSGSVSCTMFANRPQGRRYLLFLDTMEPPIVVDGCGGSTELDNPGTPEVAGYLAAVERVLAAGELPSTGGAPPLDHGLPWLPVAAIAVLGPLAFLAGSVLLSRRGEPHSG